MIEIRNLEFSWNQTELVLSVDRLSCAESEKILIQGPSGSGKSTLLSLLAGIIRPNSGSISINNTSLTHLNSKKLDAFRAENIGYIFQRFNLLPYLTIEENIALGCLFSNERMNRAKSEGRTMEDRIAELLKSFGLEHLQLTDLDTGKLSVGQQQRVAAARAMIGSPPLILADEPVSSLDSVNKKNFMDRLISQINLDKSALIMVSHDEGLASFFDRVIPIDQFKYKL